MPINITVKAQGSEKFISVEDAPTGEEFHSTCKLNDPPWSIKDLSQVGNFGKIIVRWAASEAKPLGAPKLLSVEDGKQVDVPDKWP